MKHQEIFFHN